MFNHKPPLFHTAVSQATVFVDHVAGRPKRDGGGGGVDPQAYHLRHTFRKNYSEKDALMFPCSKARLPKFAV